MFNIFLGYMKNLPLPIRIKSFWGVEEYSSNIEPSVNLKNSWMIKSSWLIQELSDLNPN